MRTSLMIVTLAVLLALFAAVDARYSKKMRDDYLSYVDWVRGKRQSHPDATVARIPQTPFSGDPNGNEASPERVPPSDSIPAPAEYLTPPAPDAPLPIASQLTPQQPPPPSDKWDLGYEASDILIPPVPDDQAVQYDTLKLFTLIPNSSQPQSDLLDSFGPVEQEPAADSRTPFVDSYRPEFQRLQEDDSPQEKPQAPVYTFVKTDPNGHFKWGVHIGH